MPKPPRSTTDSFRSHKHDTEPPVIIQTYKTDGLIQRKGARTLAELHEIIAKPTNHGVSGTLVFLRGHQPRDWVLAIGERYKIEYEFWRRHLDLGEVNSHAEVPTDSFLPSNNTHIFQLFATTLGVTSNSPSQGKTGHELLARLRNSVDAWMTEYKKKTSKDWLTIQQGQSIFRNFALHDLNLFSFQQNISVWIGKESNEAWIGKHVTYLEITRL